MNFCCLKATNVRVESGHAEYDSSDWIFGFMADLEVMYLLKNFNESIESLVKEKTSMKTKGWLTTCVKTITSFLHKNLIKNQQKIEQTAVSKGPLSVHLPLHRYLANFVHQIVKHFPDVNLNSLFDNPTHSVVKLLIEQPLQVQGKLKNCGFEE